MGERDRSAGMSERRRVGWIGSGVDGETRLRRSMGGMTRW